MDVSEVKERWSRVQNNKNWMNRPNEELFMDFVRCYILLKRWWKCRQISASHVFVFWPLLVPLSAPCAKELGMMLLGQGGGGRAGPVQPAHHVQLFQVLGTGCWVLICYRLTQSINSFKTLPPRLVLASSYLSSSTGRETTKAAQTTHCVPWWIWQKWDCAPAVRFVLVVDPALPRSPGAVAESTITRSD